MQVDKEHIQLLTEVGYAAAIYGEADKAEPIFDALMDIVPGNAAGPIGYGLSGIMQGRFDEAIDILERKGIDATVSADEARAIHLLALYLAGRKNEARRLGEQYIADAEFVIASDMAESINNS